MPDFVDLSKCNGKKERITVCGVAKSSYGESNRVVAVAAMAKKYRIGAKRLEGLALRQGWGVGWATTTKNGDPVGKPFKAIQVK